MVPDPQPCLREEALQKSVSGRQQLVSGVPVSVPRDHGTVLERARVQEELAPKGAHPHQIVSETVQ